MKEKNFYKESLDQASADCDTIQAKLCHFYNQFGPLDLTEKPAERAPN